MKKSEFIELANRVIDGLGSEHDRSALEAVLRSSTEMRLEFEQLSALTRILDSVGSVEPPPGLSERIMASIPRGAPVKRQSWIAEVAEALSGYVARKPAWSFAYASVAGAFIGVVALSLVQLGPKAGTDAQGYENTVGTIGAIEGDSGNGVVFEREGLNVAAETFKWGDIQIVEFEVAVESGTDWNLVVTATSEGMPWSRVESISGDGLEDAAIRGPVALFSNVSTGQYRLIGSATHPDFGCTISINGEVAATLEPPNVVGSK